jgi:hypothetical protein
MSILICIKGALVGLERKRFFFEKKKQKTFIYCGLWRWCCHRPQDQKFFASPGGAPFFQKRSASFLYEAF